MTNRLHPLLESTSQLEAESGINLAHAANKFYVEGQGWEWEDDRINQLEEVVGSLIGEGTLGGDALVIKNLGIHLGLTSLEDLLPPPIGRIQAIDSVMWLQAQSFGLKPRVHKEQFGIIRDRISEATEALVSTVSWGTKVSKPQTIKDFIVLKDREDIVIAYGGDQAIPISRNRFSSFDTDFYNPCEDDVDEEFSMTIGDQVFDIRSGMTRGVYAALSAVNGDLDKYQIGPSGISSTVITGERTPRNGYWLMSKYLSDQTVPPSELQGQVRYELHNAVKVGFRPAIVLEGLGKLAIV
jgi:hypothetical protein